MFLKLNCYFKNLINSYYFPIISALIGGISFILGIQLIGFIFVVLTGCYCLIIQKNVTPIIPLVLTFIISIRQIDKLTSIYVLIPLFVPAIFCIVYHFIKFKISIKFGSLTLPLLFVTVVTFLGGFGSYFNRYFTDGIAYVLTSSIVPLVVYLFFFSSIENTKLLKLKEYLIICLVAFCVVVSIETLVQTNALFFSIVDTGYIGTHHMGWLNTGFAGYFHLLSVGATYYLMFKSKNIFLPFLLVLFSLIVTWCSHNDGTFGTIVIMMPFVLFLASFRVNRQLQKQIIILFIFLIVAVLVLLVIFLLNSEALEFLRQHFLNDTGRSAVYIDGYVLFESNPLFGGSFGGVYHIENEVAISSGYIHSTLLQVIYSMGIIGLLVYVFFYVRRIKIFANNDSDFNFFMFVSFLGYQCYAMIDNAEFSFLTAVITIVTVCVEIINKSNPQNELPLINQVV